MRIQWRPVLIIVSKFLRWRLIPKVKGIRVSVSTYHIALKSIALTLECYMLLISMITLEANDLLINRNITPNNDTLL